MKAVKLLNTLFAGLLVSSLIAQAPASADTVYSWKDAQGKVHYSTKKGAPGAKPAKLPEITRGDYKVVAPKIPTCKEHGGIDCQSGPDGDGSVICNDGFTGALTRYSFNCNSPRLKIADISDLEEDGSFKVFVRNEKSVEADRPSLFIKMPDGNELELEGPKNIEAFGLAEFSFKPKGSEVVKEKPFATSLLLSCANCS